MASTDARPIPRRAVAYRITLPILDADGDPVAAATGLSSVVSKDGAASAAGATPGEIGDGLYFVDLTASEMTADTVAGVLKTTTVGAKNTPFVLYPERPLDLESSVSDAAAAAGDFDAAAGLSASDDFYNGALLVFVSGALAGIARKISDYTGSTRNLVFSGGTGAADAPFPAAPANGDKFVIIGRIG